MKGNLGDHLIWAGTDDLFRGSDLPVVRVGLGELTHVAHPRSTLVIPGSGALSRRWHEWLPETVVKASRHFRRVIVLPSSYDLSVPVLTECLRLPNVYAFAREERSYQAITTSGAAGGLALDCAVYHSAFEDRALAGSRNTDDEDRLLVALREDECSLLPILGLRPEPSLNKDISLSCADLSEWLAAIEAAGVVVTDRLHVAVAATLLGKRLVFVDPYDAKISTYWAFTFEDAFDDRVTESSLAWLVARGLVVPSLRTTTPEGAEFAPERRGPEEVRAESGTGVGGESQTAARRARVRGVPPVRICAVGCFMGSVHLLRASMSHLILNGVRDFYLFDHGSRPELAKTLERSLGFGDVRVTVLRKETPPFFQKAMVGVLTELAAMDGFEMALAFDADEFWCSTVPGRILVEQIATELPERVAAVRVPVATYAQHRDVEHFRVETLKTCKYLVVPDADDSRSEREQVDAGMPFLAMPFPPKVIARLLPGVRFTEGQHGITGGTQTRGVVDAGGIVVRHLSLPARQELVGKREHGLRRIAAGYGADLAWQVNRLAGMTDAELDGYWAENSWCAQEDGHVSVGKYSSVVEDTALVQIGEELMAATGGTGSQQGDDRLGMAEVLHVDAGKMERLLEMVLDDYGGADLLLAERMDEIVSLRDCRDALEEELAAAHVELGSQSEMVAELTRDLKHALSLQEEAMEAVRAVERSTSWRLTAPLRSLKRGVRRQG